MTYESEVEMMRCMNCYQEIPDSCKFCPNCGAKQPVQKMEPVSQVKEEKTDNITEDTAEVQQSAEKVQSEEDVQPEEKVQSEEDVQPEEKVQPEEDVQPTEPTQPADVAGSYQNDPYKSVNQEQNTSYGEPNNYEYGQGYGQQNQNYNQQNQNYTQQAPNYGQQNQGYYQQNNFNGMPQEASELGSISYIINYFNIMLLSPVWCSGNRILGEDQ
ncbi:MAG: zinc-ribbon domain-containing protein [Mediterraneibacter faecis]